MACGPTIPLPPRLRQCLHRSYCPPPLTRVAPPTPMAPHCLHPAPKQRFSPPFADRRSGWRHQRDGTQSSPRSQRPKILRDQRDGTQAARADRGAHLFGAGADMRDDPIGTKEMPSNLHLARGDLARLKRRQAGSAAGAYCLFWVAADQDRSGHDGSDHARHPGRCVRTLGRPGVVRPEPCLCVHVCAAVRLCVCVCFCVSVRLCDDM